MCFSVSSESHSCSFEPSSRSTGNVSCSSDGINVSGVCTVQVPTNPTTSYVTLDTILYKNTNLSFGSPEFLSPRSTVRVATLAMGADGCRPINESFAYIEEAGKRGADLILLPEEFSGTPDATPPLRRSRQYGSNANCTQPVLPHPAETLEGDTIQELRRLAVMWNLNIIAPIRRLQSEQSNTQFNSQVAINRIGKIVGVYDKIYPVLGPRGKPGDGYGEEGVTPNVDGGEIGIFEFDFGKVGAVTCFDVNFPELWIRLRAADVDLVVWPSAMKTPDPFIRAYATLLRRPILACGHPGEIVDGTGLPIKYLSEDRNDKDYQENWKRMKLGDIDLDRMWIHGDNNQEKLEELMKKYPEIAVDYAGPPHFLLRSRMKSFSIRKLLKENKMEPLMTYTDRSRKGLNDIRNRGDPIGTIDDKKTKPTIAKQNAPRDVPGDAPANVAGARLPRGGGPCSNELDCELLGKCQNGICECKPGWTGRYCGTLNLLPADREHDLIWPSETKDSTWPVHKHPISWGASLFVDDVGTEHLFAGVGCYDDSTGMHARGFQIVHLRGKHGGGRDKYLGPFKFHDVALHQTRINPHIMQLSSNSSYALFYVGFEHQSSNYTCTGSSSSGNIHSPASGDPPIPKGVCNNFNCYTASCQESKEKCLEAVGFPEWGNPCFWNNAQSRCVFNPWKSVFGLRVAKSNSLDGPWLEHNIKLQGGNGLNQGTNPSGMVHPKSGEIFLAYRYSLPLSNKSAIGDDEGNLNFYENVTEVLGLASAKNWGADFMKIGGPSKPISFHQAEDPFIWRDSESGHFHIIAHDIIRLNSVQCNGSGWAGKQIFYNSFFFFI